MTTPRIPKRPLWWSDALLDLQDTFIEWGVPCYIVGGAVRDAWLHFPIHDLDLTTPHNAIQLAKRLANHLKGDVYVMDEERDVARVLVNQPDFVLNIDISRMRGDSLADDLADRDFTINAMAVDLLGSMDMLIDPLNGETDLADKIIRQCNPQSIQNDPVRAIRAVRQSIGLLAHIVPETLTAIRAHAHAVTQTSPERVRDEFIKLLSGSRPSVACRILDAVGLLGHIIPQTSTFASLTPSPNSNNGWSHTFAMIEKLHGIYMTISPQRTDATAAVFDLGMMVTALDLFRKKLQTHIAHTWANDRPHKALLMLGGLIHLLPPKTVDSIALSLRLSNDEKKRLVRMISAYPNVLKMTTDPLSLHYFWRENGDAGVDACLIALAYYLAHENTLIKQDVWLKHLEHVQILMDAYYTRYDTLVAPTPLITGDDLVEQFGLAPGKQIGKLLTVIREAQVLGEIHTKDEALALIKDHL
jgi:tRNA nucleotidyltransferase/poly(A) polymerase